jgi:hypothetical protein
MHPKNQMLASSSHFDWLKDYRNANGSKSAKSYMKRECRRTVRKDGKRFIAKELLDNG